MYEYDCDKVKLQFTSNTVIICNVPKTLVNMDPYNSLWDDIHKNLVGSRGVFMIIIDDLFEGHSENEETSLGLSQKI